MKKIGIKVFGLLVLTIIFFYIYQKIETSIFEKIKNIESARLFFYVIICCVLIMFCHFVETLNWRNIIYKISSVKIPVINVYSVFSKSNIFKYIPGNFSQFVVRNVLINRFNVSHKKVVYSSLLETVFIASVSFFWTILFILSGLLKSPINFSIRSSSDEFIFFLLFVILAFSILAVVFYKKIIFFFKSFDFLENVKNIIQLFSLSFIVFTSTYILFSTSFILGFTVLFGISLSLHDVLFITSVVISAGLVGMLTPGLSAGLGVREGVYIFFLGPLFGNEIIVIISLIHRLICVLADVCTLASSYIIIKFSPKENLKVLE